jgi:hypothetical protein
VAECSNHGVNKLQVSPNRTAIRIGNNEVRIVGPELKGSDYDLHDGLINGKYEDLAIRAFLKGNLLAADLTFTPGRDGTVKFGDGKVFFGADQEDGYIESQFNPRLTVTGKIYVDGIPRPFSGIAYSMHQTHGVRPTQVASQVKLLIFVADVEEGQPQSCFYMLQIRTPPEYGQEILNYSMYHQGEKLVGASTLSSLTPSDSQIDDRSGYPIPVELVATWRGINPENASFKAECRFRPQVLVHRVNLLELLPFVMRKVVETFITRPYVYVWLDRAELEVKEGPAQRRLPGWMFCEICFLNSD